MTRIYHVEDIMLGFERNNAIHNGYTDAQYLKPKSLCTYSVDRSLLEYGYSYKTLSSFAFYNGNDGTVSKTKLTTMRFPIGCKIYYYAGATLPILSSGSFIENTDIYSTHDDVDARYSAVTGSNISLSSGAVSDVYLRVQIVNSYYWRPYGTVNDGVEIIVDGMSLVAENFYIYLGKTSRVVENEPWHFQLEDNNPLYYFDGKELIPYENYLISTQGGSVDLDGFGYGTCTSTAAAKVVSLSGYSLERGFVSVYFTHAVQANATMDIESQGAKNIYAYGAAIKAGMIQAYDIATFWYDGVKYNLVGVYHSDQVMIKKELPTITLSNDGGEGLLIGASGNNAWAEFLNLLPGKYKVTVRRNVKTSNDKMTSHNVMVSLKYRPNSESSNYIPITCANVPLIPVNGQIGVNTIEMTGFFQLYGTVPSAFCLDLDHFGLTDDQFGGNTPYIGGVNIGAWGNTDYIMFERIANQEPVD